MQLLDLGVKSGERGEGGERPGQAGVPRHAPRVLVPGAPGARRLADDAAGPLTGHAVTRLGDRFEPLERDGPTAQLAGAVGGPRDSPQRNLDLVDRVAGPVGRGSGELPVLTGLVAARGLEDHLE